jgi:hypothetical protein
MIIPKRSHKRAQDERPEDEPPNPADVSPPPSKKHRRDASASTAVQAKVASKTGKTSTATLATQKAPTTPRLIDTGRSHKQTAVPQTPVIQRWRPTGIYPILESCFPFSVLPPKPNPIPKACVTPMRRSKKCLKSRTLVLNSSASTVKGVQILGTSAGQAETQTPATQTMQDPFKSWARSVGQSKLGKRKASAMRCVPYFLLR